MNKQIVKIILMLVILLLAGLVVVVFIARGLKCKLANWSANQFKRTVDKAIEISLSESDLPSTDTQLTDHRETYHAVPGHWNGVYQGDLDGVSTKLIVANGSITYQQGMFPYNLPHLITIPEYYLYQGIPVLITDSYILISTDLSSYHYQYNNGVIEIYKDDQLIGKFHRTASFSNNGKIPSVWNGFYSGNVAFKNIRVWISGGSLTAKLGTFYGKQAIVTLPEQAYYTEYDFYRSQNKLTLSIPTIHLEIQLLRTNKSIEVLANGKNYGKVEIGN